MLRREEEILHKEVAILQKEEGILNKDVAILNRRRESFTRTRESLANLFLDKVRLLSGGGLEISQQFFLKTFDVTQSFQN